MWRFRPYTGPLNLSETGTGIAPGRYQNKLPNSPDHDQPSQTFTYNNGFGTRYGSYKTLEEVGG
jgi:hypothetical protein